MNFDDIMKNMQNPITQSQAWQKFQEDLGETSFLEQGTDYQYLAILKKTPVGNYLYLPYGPIAKDKKAFQAALKSLSTLAKKHQAIFIRIEPQNPDFTKYLPANTKKTKDLNPKDTWILDITPDKATILTNFSQGTRTRYNTYAKKGLTVESTKDPAQIKYLVESSSGLILNIELMFSSFSSGSKLIIGNPLDCLENSGTSYPFILYTLPLFVKNIT